MHSVAKGSELVDNSQLAIVFSIDATEGVGTGKAGNEADGVVQAPVAVEGDVGGGALHFLGGFLVVGVGELGDLLLEFVDVLKDCAEMVSKAASDGTAVLTALHIGGLDGLAKAGDGGEGDDGSCFHLFIIIR